MLGRLGFGKPTTIDALLDSRRVTLEEILDMEDCLDQVRMRHKKLIDYIRQPLILSQLIRYLVLGEKYVWIASEIITSAVPAIMDTLVLEHKEILLVYWTLLYQNYRLTPQQVVYFVKVNQVLLARRPGDMIQFIFCLSDLLPHWIYHLEDPQGSQLAELLVSLFQAEQATEGVGIIKWLHDHGLIRLLVNKLDPSLDPMLHNIIQQILCDIVRLSQTSHQDIKTIGINDLITDLTSKEIMTGLIDSMLDTTKPYATDSFICGAKLLINLIRYNDERHLMENGLTQGNSDILATMLSCCTTRMDDFLNLLENPRSKLKDRLGMERLVLIELIAEWVHCANLYGVGKHGDRFKLACCEQGVIGRILDLFFAFPSCNIMHSVVCDIVGQIFESKCLERKSNQQMVLEVFTNGRLINRILDVDILIKTSKETGSTTQLGYMGHLTLLTKSILQTLRKQPDLIPTLKNNTSIDIDWIQWDTYATSVMVSCADEEVPLGGVSLPTSPTICNSPTPSFPLPPPPIHIPSSLPSSILHSTLPSPSLLSLPSPSLLPLPSSYMPTELSVDAS
ncbi:SIT4 phosphatase-associated protein-domain-containing protein [Chlamydoabsidia padenii]|nr:SIT4 phosphatase-associated protein-domain-containing protein [Chlamydoabsidia padenii]